MARLCLKPKREALFLCFVYKSGITKHLIFLAAVRISILAFFFYLPGRHLERGCGQCQSKLLWPYSPLISEQPYSHDGKPDLQGDITAASVAVGTAVVDHVHHRDCLDVHVHGKWDSDLL